MREWKSRRKRRMKMLVFLIGFCVFSLLFVGICSFLRKGNRYMEMANAKYEEEYIIDIEGLSQKNIPTGCEAVSTVMVLNYYGIEITPEEFINEYLPMEGFYREGNILYGPNPEETFAGNPYKKSSLGCYPPVIAEAIENMKNDDYSGSKDIMVKIFRGISLEDICNDYVSKGIPVLVWITMDMSEPKEGFRYLLEDGTEYVWMAGEHCMVLCGFSDETYYLKDPLKEGETVKYEKSLVQKRYEQMGENVLIVHPN